MIFQSINGWTENMCRAEDEDLFVIQTYVSGVAYSPKLLAVHYLDTVNNSCGIVSEWTGLRESF